MNNDVYSCCFTGYRPSKLPFGSRRDCAKYRQFENSLLECLTQLVSEGCTTFYSGMAMGFDIICAELVLLLKELYPDKDIKLICVIPYQNQVEGFYDDWRERYFEVLEKCDKKILIAKDYHIGCYQKRNTYMVDNSDYVVTWFDGKPGGTKNTLRYANKKQRYIYNVNPDFSDEPTLQQKISF